MTRSRRWHAAAGLAALVVGLVGGPPAGAQERAPAQVPDPQPVVSAGMTSLTVPKDHPRFEAIVAPYRAAMERQRARRAEGDAVLPVWAELCRPEEAGDGQVVPIALAFQTFQDNEMPNCSYGQKAVAWEDVGQGSGYNEWAYHNQYSGDRIDRNYATPCTSGAGCIVIASANDERSPDEYAWHVWLYWTSPSIIEGTWCD
jgi:hypothetical protein